MSIAQITNSLRARLLRVSKLRLDLVCIVSLLVAISVSAFISPALLKRHEVFTDLVAGLISYEGKSKTAENLIFQLGGLIFLACFALGLLWLSRKPKLQSEVAEQATDAVKSKTIIGVKLVLVVGALFLGYRPGFESKETAVGLGLLLYGLCYLARTKATELSLVKAIYPIFVGCVSVMAIYGLGAIVHAIGPVPNFFLSPSPILFSLPLIASLFWGQNTRLWSVMRKVGLLAQVFIPALLLRYIRVDYIDTAQLPSVGPNATGCLVIFIACGIFTCLAAKHAYDRWQTDDSASSLEKDISLFSLFSLAAYCNFFLPTPAIYSHDDFHFGEMILPWHQFFEKGQKLYQDFVPVQGLDGLAMGALNYFFYANDASTLFHAEALMRGIFSGLLAISFSLVAGRPWAFFMLPLLFSDLDRFYLATFAIFLLAAQSLRSNHRRWLLIYLVICPLAFFWNGTSAVALGLGFLPVAIYKSYILFTQRSLITSKGGLVADILLSLLAIILILTVPLRGLVQFLIENGSTNALAYGSLYFSPKWCSTPQENCVSRVAFEILRVGGWILGGVATLRGLMLAIKSPRWFGSTAFVLSFAALVMIAVLFPYAMGRIDAPTSISRTGVVSVMALGLIIPGIYAVGVRELGLKLFSPILVSFALGVVLHVRVTTLNGILDRLSNQLAPVAGQKFVNGADVGIPRLGKAFIADDRLQEMLDIKKELSSLLKPGETYLDFTNRSLFFYLFDQYVPAQYSADYLMANEKIQRRVLERVEREKTAVIWIAPRIPFDRAPMSMRAYRLYKQILLMGYQYYEMGGNRAYLVRGDRFAELKLTAANIYKWRTPFFDGSLHFVPQSWGRSWQKLSSRFVQDAEVPVTGSNAGFRLGSENWRQIVGKDPTLEFELPQAIDGRSRDFMLLSLDRYPKSKRSVIATLFWRRDGEDFSDERTVSFYAESGNILIPVASDPVWLFSLGIKGFKLLIRDDKPGARWRGTIRPVGLIK